MFFTPEGTDAALDLVVIIDAASWLKRSRFRKVKSFVKSLIGKYVIKPTSMRVGIIAASRSAQVVFDFNTQNLRTMNQRINRIRRKRGTLMLGQAITQAKTTFFAASRKDVPNVLLVIVAGDSKDDIKTPSLDLHKTGVTVITVGIKPRFEKADLMAMSSPPVSGNMIITNLKTLTQMMSMVIGKIAAGKLK